MPRNVEKDAIEEQKRREKLLIAGLKLFSSYGIESVKLQAVADEAEVGIATFYNYYVNKVNFAIAVSAYIWKHVWTSKIDQRGKDLLEKFNAYQGIEYYLNLIIDLYANNPEILRFSGYFKTYMNTQSADIINDNEHLDTLKPVRSIFHNLYEKAKEDKSIRTDISEQEIFTSIAITMLGVAERYALGIVWAGHSDNNYTRELYLLKDMILNWVKVV